MLRTNQFLRLNLCKSQVELAEPVDIVRRASDSSWNACCQPMDACCSPVAHCRPRKMHRHVDEGTCPLTCCLLEQRLISDVLGGYHAILHRHALLLSGSLKAVPEQHSGIDVGVQPGSGMCNPGNGVEWSQIIVECAAVNLLQQRSACGAGHESGHALGMPLIANHDHSPDHSSAFPNAESF